MTQSQCIGKYELLEELGRGGFAVVYKARDTSLDRIVALKVLHAHIAENRAFVRRFEQEARTSARFDHPRVVTIYEVGEEAGQHYIAMKYLPGRGLDELLTEAGGPLSLEQIIAIVTQIADALDYIHRRGAIHRDVKPANVILSDEGHATLLDFGIVRAADGTQLTTTGEMMGTPRYMSPEQAEGWEIDHRSDIYALGVLAYQMCTGKAPFDDVSPLVVLRLHADKAPPLPHELNPDLPASVVRVLLKALAKRPDERYQSAGAFARALREAPAGLRRAQVERERQARLTQLYERLQDAAARKDWGQVLVRGGQIRAMDENYKDVSVLLERARRNLRRRQQQGPSWAWPVGGVAALGLVVGFLWLIFGNGIMPGPTSIPTKALISTPTETPTAIIPSATPTDMPTATPTLIPIPTVTPSPELTLSVDITQTRSADGMTMVYVPGGTFPMGSTDDEIDDVLQLCNEYRDGCKRDWFEDEQPVHDVTLDAFWLDQTEVTNAQYATFLNAWGNQTEGGVTWLDLEEGAGLIEQSGGEFQPRSIYADHPVIDVSWYGAVAYCKWAGARLPTEAEWEYAARGEEENVYPWGDTFDGTQLNFCDVNCTYDWKATEYDDGYELTAPAGSFPDGASWCGALDMAGNVWEWTASLYKPYPYVEHDGRNDLDAVGSRVLRGGSWISNPHRVCGAYRSSPDPDYTGNGIGFRCARSSE